MMNDTTTDASTTTTYSHVKHGKNYGTLTLTLRFLLFEPTTISSTAAGSNDLKKLKMSLTSIVKHQKSPAKNTTSVAKLRIVGHDDRSKIFEFDSREVLVKVDKELSALRRGVDSGNEENQKKKSKSPPATPYKRSTNTTMVVNDTTTAASTTTTTYSNVKHGKNYGTLMLASRFLLFEPAISSTESSSSTTAAGSNNDEVHKKLKMSLTRIVKHQKSPTKNTTSVAKLRIVSHDSQSKIFEFDSREELVKVDKELSAFRRAVAHSEKEKKPTTTGPPATPPRHVKEKASSPVIKRPGKQKQSLSAAAATTDDNNDGPTNNNKNNTSLKKEQQQEPLSAGAFTSKSDDNTNIDSTKENKKKTIIAKKTAGAFTTTDSNTNNDSKEIKKKPETAKKTDQPQQQEPAIVVATAKSDVEKGEIAETTREEQQQQSSQYYYSFYVMQARLYIRTWSYTLLCFILAIAGTIGSGMFRKSCSVMFIQLQNLQTLEPIEETQRSYGFKSREIEPGEEADYRNCRDYTSIESRYTFADVPFQTANLASISALTCGSILCVLVLVVPIMTQMVPYTTIQKYSMRRLFCSLAILFQITSVQMIFGTDFCQQHICHAGSGVGSAIFAILMWILLLLVLLVGPIFIPP